MSKQHLETAIKASLEAGKEIMEIYDSENFGIEQKADDSPLTIADKNANDVINSYLKKTAIPIISEENKQTDFSERKHWNQCWIVDPLDGTKEFIKRNGEFTVNIALIENGSPVLGVIFAPATKELYYTIVAENKAYKATIESGEISCEQLFSIAEEITPNTVEDNVKVVGSRSHMNEETKNFIATLEAEYPAKPIEVVPKGSSLKFCIVAEGKAHYYPRFAPTMEWDTAAGQAICEAVGISVISQETNAKMRYNKENLLNSWFLVAKK